MVCGLPPGDYNLTSGCHEDGTIANFSPLVCSTTGEAGRNVQTVCLLICGLPLAFSRDLRPATIFYSVGERTKKNFQGDFFSKSVAFKATITKFLM
jgi:hypothetical protein